MAEWHLSAWMGWWGFLLMTNRVGRASWLREDFGSCLCVRGLTCGVQKCKLFKKYTDKFWAGRKIAMCSGQIVMVSGMFKSMWMQRIWTACLRLISPTPYLHQNNFSGILADFHQSYRDQPPEWECHPTSQCHNCHGVYKNAVYADWKSWGAVSKNA